MKKPGNKRDGEPTYEILMQTFMLNPLKIQP